MERNPDFPILEEIRKRWSPRAYSNEPILAGDLSAILEASRFAPSARNEQPWRFIVADREPALRWMLNILSENNLIWAQKAPVLILLASKVTYTKDGKPNDYHAFDAGAAWAFMSLEATRRGLFMHAMGAFDKDAARTLFAIEDDYELLVVIALGKMGNKEELSEELQAREKINPRKPLEELVFTLKE